MSIHMSEGSSRSDLKSMMNELEGLKLKIPNIKPYVIQLHHKVALPNHKRF